MELAAISVVHVIITEDDVIVPADILVIVGVVAPPAPASVVNCPVPLSSLLEVSVLKPL